MSTYIYFLNQIFFSHQLQKCIEIISTQTDISSCWLYSQINHWFNDTLQKATIHKIKILRNIKKNRYKKWLSLNVTYVLQWDTVLAVVRERLMIRMNCMFPISTSVAPFEEVAFILFTHQVKHTDVSMYK